MVRLWLHCLTANSQSMANDEKPRWRVSTISSRFQWRDQRVEASSPRQEPLRTLTNCNDLARTSAFGRHNLDSLHNEMTALTKRGERKRTPLTPSGFNPQALPEAPYKRGNARVRRAGKPREIVTTLQQRLFVEQARCPCQRFRNRGAATSDTRAFCWIWVLVRRRRRFG